MRQRRRSGGTPVAEEAKAVSNGAIASASRSEAVRGKPPAKASEGHYLGSAAGVQGADITKVAPMVVRTNKEHKTARWQSLKIVFVLVGLPARGKSFISMRMQAFLSWLGVDTKVFNVGQHRRNVETKTQDAKYFDAADSESKRNRDALAVEVLDLLLAWLDARPQAAAVFDATNSTVDRRRRVRQHIYEHDPSYVVIFIESYCNDPEVLEANIRMKLAKSPDYAGVPYEEARRDFVTRIQNYEKVYEPLDDTGEKEHDLSYIKLVNLSSHLVAHKVYGLAATALLPYLMALHISGRPVWLVRMGEADQRGSPQSVSQRQMFGELPMSKAGEAWAANLAHYVAEHEEMASARVLVSSHRRALDMAAMLDPHAQRTSVRAFLNPMDWGSYDGIRRREFQEKTSAAFYEAFTKDPVNTRFPGGESYADFVRRLMTVLVEVEQQVEPVIVIAPLTTLQVLNCYFGKRPVNEASETAIPQHVVVQWVPDGGNFTQTTLTESDLLQKVSGKQDLREEFIERRTSMMRQVGSIMYGKKSGARSPDGSPQKAA